MLIKLTFSYLFEIINYVLQGFKANLRIFFLKFLRKTYKLIEKNKSMDQNYVFYIKESKEYNYGLNLL